MTHNTAKTILIANGFGTLYIAVYAALHGEPSAASALAAALFSFAGAWFAAKRETDGR